MKKMNIEEKLYLSRHKGHKVSHIRIIDEKICNRRCTIKICTVVCPAKCYEKDEQGNIMVHHENCLECGSCRIVCSERNVEWRYPLFGKGVNYKYG